MYRKGPYLAGTIVALVILALTGILAPAQGRADVLPKPTYDNTFSLFFVNGYHWRLSGHTAYRPGWGSHYGRLQPWMAEEILKDILRYVGPPGPYGRIGTAESVYPLLWVDQASDWDYSIDGGAAGIPAAITWREWPGGPASTLVADVGRDSGTHIVDLVLELLQDLEMPLTIFYHGYNQSPQRWEDNGYDPAVPLDLTAYLEMTRPSCMEYEDGKITICDNMNGIPEPWDYVEDPSWNGNGPRGTFLTLSRLLDPAVRDDYVRRNYLQAFQHTASLAQQFPGLITALTIDPEIGMNNARNCAGDPIGCDFSENAMVEWRDWLQHSGMYDNQTGQYAGEGCPDNGGQGYPTLEVFNQLTGSSFTTWEEVDPRSPLAGPGLMDMYFDGGDLDGFFSGLGDTSIQGWCEVMVDHFCEDLVAWVVEELDPYGYGAERVFTHQIPGGFVDDAIDPGAPWGYQFRLPTLMAVQNEHGSPGITGFRLNSMNGELFSILRDSLSAGRNWGHFEWNPISWVLDPTGISSNDYEMWMNAFDTTYSHGCHLLSPYRWWVPPELEPWSSIWPYEQAFRVRGEPVDFQARLQACHDFVQSIRFQPFSRYNNGPGAAPDYEPPAVGGVSARYLGESGVRLGWSPLIWPDIPQFYWYDTHARPLWPEMVNVFGWPDFTMGHFEVYRDTLALFLPGPDNRLAIVSNHDSTYTDSTVALDGWYFYKVLAWDNDATCSPTAQTIAMTPEAHVTPASVADTVSAGEVICDTLRAQNQGLYPLLFVAWLEDDGGATPPWAQITPQGDTLVSGESVDLLLSLGTDQPDPGQYEATLMLACNDPYHRLVQVPINLTVEGASADGPGPGSVTLSATATPNPAGNEVLFRINGAQAEGILVIYDASGRLVDKLTLPAPNAGSASVRWKKPSSVGGGLYVWRLVIGRAAVAGRLVLVP